MRILFALLIFGLMSTTHVLGQLPDQNHYLSSLAETLKQAWPNNQTINIVVHGHSVPAGYFKTPEVRTFESCPHLLHRALKEKYPNAVINVIVTAIGGENSITGADRFERDVLPLQPDLLLIDYGLNDRRAGLVPAKTAWKKMISLSQAANIPVILLTPTADKRANMFSDNDPLTEHATQIRMLAKESGIALADSYAAVVGYLKDGGDLDAIMSQVNHPNLKGHEMVAQELLKWFP